MLGFKKKKTANTKLQRFSVIPVDIRQVNMTAVTFSIISHQPHTRQFAFLIHRPQFAAHLVVRTLKSCA